MVAYACNRITPEMGQEDQKFKASLRYIQVSVRTCALWDPMFQNQNQQSKPKPNPNQSWNKTPHFRVPLSLQAKTARISVMSVVALGYRNDVPALRVFSAELDFIFVFHDVFIIFRGFMSVLAGTSAPNFYSFRCSFWLVDSLVSQ